MVGPAVQREAVVVAISGYKVSERRACRLVGIRRSVARYESRRTGDAALRARLRELAEMRPRFGYRRLWVLLGREGIKANHKRVYRLYKAEGLCVRKKRRKRLATGPGNIRVLPGRPNERWSMDFMADALADSRRFRTLNIVDDYTRECVAIEVDTSLPGLRVVRVLETLAATRGLPKVITCDNGPEFTGKALDQWAFQAGVQINFIPPGKPTQNAYVESFNGKFRDECLDQSWFTSIKDARYTIEAWRDDYNRFRPHSSIGNRTPEEFSKQFDVA